MFFDPQNSNSGFPGGRVDKNPPANDLDSILGLGRIHMSQSD